MLGIPLPLLEDLPRKTVQIFGQSSIFITIKTFSRGFGLLFAMYLAIKPRAVIGVV